nr:beta-propeller fold lactonase family protein [Caldilineaceae bacterium]
METTGRLSRRTFLRVSGAAAGVALLAACQPITRPAESGGAGNTIPAAAGATAPAGGEAGFAYVGAYTRGAPGGWSDAAEANHPTGVTVFAATPVTGELTLVETVPSDNPSFVAIHPSGTHLYVTNEIADYEGNDAGSIEAYAIDDASGKLTLLNRQAIGSIPAHLQVDPTGNYVVVANYIGANYQALPINEDGSLGEVSSEIKQEGSGPNQERQEAPHPHCVMFDPAGNFIATADLGTDEVAILKLADGQLSKVSSAMLAPGSGPRHLSFHPSG